MGPPNVGKSVIFNYLTGMNVNCANYSGTTIDYLAGKISIAGKKMLLVDVPGTYTLNATNQAEQVAVDMLKGLHRAGYQPSFMHCSNDTGDYSSALSPRPGSVVCVLDANNIENSLYLLLQIMEFKIPTIAVLNRMDLARDKNLSIDHVKLSKDLNIQVIPMVAVENQGFDQLESALENIVLNPVEPEVNWDINCSCLWKVAEKLRGKICVQGKLKKLSNRSVWGNKLVSPWPGRPWPFSFYLSLLHS